MLTSNELGNDKIKGRNYHSDEYNVDLMCKVKVIDIDNDDNDNSDEPDEEFLNRFDPTKINISVSQPTIYNLIQRMSAEPPEIDMNTSFQRHAGLWNKTDQSRLIESLLLRIPLPTFYFDGSDESHWLIVDGLQRLSAFKSFIITKDLKLTNLEYFSEFNGMKFDDLPKNMIRRIEETQIVANIIQPGTPDEVKFNIFKRINTGGFNLNNQEIRHAIFHGKPAEFVEGLSKLSSFQYFHINSKRMLDQELVTRFIAFYLLRVDAYRPRMDDFLELAMSRLKKMDDDNLNNIKSAFDLSMRRAFKLFGNRAFRRIPLEKKIPGGSKINKAMFEVWAIVLSKMSKDDFEKIQNSKNREFKERYNKLLEDKDFISVVSQGTGHKESVQKRFTMVNTLIRECLKNDY